MKKRNQYKKNTDTHTNKQTTTEKHVRQKEEEEQQEENDDNEKQIPICLFTFQRVFKVKMKGFNSKIMYQ